MTDLHIQQLDTYPFGDDSLVPIGVDVELYHQSLLAHSHRLFDRHSDKVEIIRVLSNSGAVELRVVEDTTALGKQIAIDKSLSTQDAFYFVLQKSSWGRLCITLQTFKILLASHQVFAPFLDYVLAYGVKTNDDFYKWRGGCRWNLSRKPSSMGNLETYEFCYNLEHMELNGRNWGDPWSLRQCGIYQQTCLTTHRSCWICLQVPKQARAKLDQTLRSHPYGNGSLGFHPMTPHLIFISAMTANWQAYLQHLRSKLTVLDEKACFSSLDCPSSGDFSVTLKDHQNLQLLRQKLLKVAIALDSCLKVVKGCKVHRHRLIEMKVIIDDKQSLAEIEVYINQIQGHRLDLYRILEYSLGTSKLFTTILDLRAAQMIQETNESIRASLEITQRITSEIKQENTILTAIAQQGQEDSRTLKVLSIVATIYLPATLIATLFSSSLIQLVPNNTKDTIRGTHLAISSQFWIFVVTSICLTIITIAYPVLREMRRSRII